MANGQLETEPSEFALHVLVTMRGGEDATVEATFHKMADPRSWFSVTGEMDEVLGRMAEGPRFSDLWDVERKYARVYRAWLNVRGNLDGNSRQTFLQSLFELCRISETHSVGAWQ